MRGKNTARSMEKRTSARKRVSSGKAVQSTSEPLPQPDHPPDEDEHPLDALSSSLSSAGSWLHSDDETDQYHALELDTARSNSEHDASTANAEHRRHSSLSRAEKDTDDTFDLNGSEQHNSGDNANGKGRFRKSLRNTPRRRATTTPQVSPKQANDTTESNVEAMTIQQGQDAGMQSIKSNGSTSIQQSDGTSAVTQNESNQMRRAGKSTAAIAVVSARLQKKRASTKRATTKKSASPSRAMCDICRKSIDQVDQLVTCIDCQGKLDDSNCLERWLITMQTITCPHFILWNELAKMHLTL
jgi:hypothetical protein